MNPEDIAVQRWRPVRKAVDQRNRLVRELNETNQRLAVLQAELPQAAQADRENFATAIAAGKNEPERKVEQVTARIETEQRRAEACALGVENAERELRSLCSRNATWRGETQRSIVKARSAYQAAIAGLEAAREGLADEVGLLDWLRSGSVASSVNDKLSGHIAAEADGRRALQFSDVVAALTADAEDIAPYLAAPERRGIAMEHVREAGVAASLWGGE